MAQAKMKKPSNVVERNLRLTEEIMHYLLDNPRVFNSLPDDFELVVLPDDDPNIRLYNLDLLDKYGSEGKPIVFARVRSNLSKKSDSISPSLFVPIPLAEQVGKTVTQTS